MALIAGSGLAIGVLATIAQQAVPFAAEIAPLAERGQGVGTAMTTTKPRPVDYRSAQAANQRSQPASAAIPALATCASCWGCTFETPTAPMQWPLTTIGTPPSSVAESGALRKEKRPLFIISS